MNLGSAPGLVDVDAPTTLGLILLCVSLVSLRTFLACPSGRVRRTRSRSFLICFPRPPRHAVPTRHDGRLPGRGLFPTRASLYSHIPTAPFVLARRRHAAGQENREPELLFYLLAAVRGPAPLRAARRVGPSAPIPGRKGAAGNTLQAGRRALTGRATHILNRAKTACKPLRDAFPRSPGTGSRGEHRIAVEGDCDRSGSGAGRRGASGIYFFSHSLLGYRSLSSDFVSAARFVSSSASHNWTSRPRASSCASGIWG